MTRTVAQIQADIEEAPNRLRLLRAELFEAQAARKAVVLAELAAGEKYIAIAARHGVPIGTISGWAGGATKLRYTSLSDAGQLIYRRAHAGGMGRRAAFALAAELSAGAQ